LELSPSSLMGNWSIKCNEAKFIKTRQVCGSGYGQLDTGQQDMAFCCRLVCQDPVLSFYCLDGGAVLSY
jgi:hypothetical protein